MRKPIPTLGLLCVLLLAPLSLRTPLAQTAAVAPASANARVIVKYKADSVLLRKTIQSAGTEAASAQLASRAQALGQRLGIALTAGAGISERSQVVFASGIGSEELAQRIAAQSDVEYAVPDVRRHRFGVPNDPFYATRPYDNAGTPSAGGPLVGQWYLKPPGPAATAANTAPSAIDAEGAWEHTTGSSSIVVAVVDTGIRFDHEDFRTPANESNLLPGYDMISGDSDGTFTTSNDGDGRDADASDPGDFVVAGDAGKGGCTAADITSSSWHGTETAGLIGAATDNNKGIASVGRNIRVLPVRVLGKCGGYDSDIMAGMEWAAGVAVPGVPDNPNWAKVINLSLGGTGACSAAYADVIAKVNAQGAVVVVAAGNGAADGGHSVGTPANCPGVIGVAGLRHIGTKVGFSDLGPEISISAPAGNCVNLTGSCLYPIMTTSNSGATTPVADSAGGSIYSDAFVASVGTSFSAPLVSGTVALMLSVQPYLTPDEVRFKLQQTARAFPASTVDEGGGAVAQCVAPSASGQLQCACKAGLCGAGMLDARGAVVAAGGDQARIAVTPAAPVAGEAVTFDASTSLLPNPVLTYAWTVASADGIVTGLAGDVSGPTVSATPSGAGTFVVTLTMTDSTNVVSAESKTVMVAAAASTSAAGSGGGGGALDFGWLLLLGCAVVALRIAPAGVRC